ncbi:MAG: NUDIX hydrolase [Flavobacteriales bacterium]|jgi:8-oxo-dGTP diphosphatase|nr:NUDIX hydrolase [Flavobacteriales bacterium]MBT6744961.1 NUDIX hydrolase [Flavobacteriales bacterium]
MDSKTNFNYSVSVDCVIFGYDTVDLKVLLIKRGEQPYINQWAIPGDLIHANEGIQESVQRVLKDLTGLSSLYLEQVKTFGDVGRHPLGRVFTISYYSLIKISDYKLHPSSFAKEAKWHSVKRLGELAFDHNKIFAACKEALVNSVKTKPIGFELLPKKFTLSKLQSLYEAILQEKFDKRNFRKKINSMGLLIDTDEFQKSVSHRPAKLYKFNKEKYEKLKERGFSFEI